MKKILLYTVVSLTIINGCKKNETTPAPIDPNIPIILRDKPIAELKSMLIGNWKIHYYVGGLTGLTKTITPNSFFKVLANDSIYLTLNNVLSAADIATYQRVNTPFGFSANTINSPMNGAPNQEWIFDTIKADTLGLTGNCINCGYYAMTKLP
jgi:hypothetical protein